MSRLEVLCGVTEPLYRAGVFELAAPAQGRRSYRTLAAMSRWSGPSPALTRGRVDDRHEHRLFVATSLVISSIVFAGFAQSYFLKTWIGGRSLSLVLQVHGFLMSTWVVIFMLQVFLAANGRLFLHRRLGAFSAPLALVIFALGTAVVMSSGSREATQDSHLAYFTAFDGLHLVAFIFLVAIALAFRRCKPVHKRLMAYATISLLPPALGRLIGRYGGDIPVATGTLFTMVVLTLAFAAADVAVRRRLVSSNVFGACVLVATSLATYVAQLAT